LVKKARFEGNLDWGTQRVALADSWVSVKFDRIGGILSKYYGKYISTKEDRHYRADPYEATWSRAKIDL
jgi:hypothetical protein